MTDEVAPSPTTSPLVDRARDLGREVVAEAERHGRKGMQRVGATLEAAGQQVEAELGRGAVPGVSSEHARAVGEQLGSAGRYLQGNDPRSLLADVDDAIRRHPYRAAAITFGIGWLIGRLSRPSR
jgi:hypothetical protein